MIEENTIKSNNLCLMSIQNKNNYIFNKNTLGEYIYKNDDGGNIYIIQTEFSLNNYYKIGVTINLKNRLSNYRCGAVIDPVLHYYFPIKNLNEADKILKKELQPYCVKREIYQFDNNDKIIKLINNVQLKMDCDELFFRATKILSKY
jgi:hypothetical protein